MKYPKSIITDDMGVCFRCGTYRNVECHHLMNAANRKNSTKYGLVIGLCSKCHREVHASGMLMNAYKRTAQIKFEEKYSHDKWMEVFNKNYL